MRFDLSINVYYLFNVVTSVLFADYFISTVVKHPKKPGWFPITAFILLFVLSMPLRGWFITPILTALLIFIASFRYEMLLYQRILLTAICVVLDIVVGNMTALLVSLFFHVDFSLVKKGAYFVLTTVLSKFLQFWIYYFVRFFRLRAPSGSSLRSRIMLAVLPLSSGIVAYALFVIIRNDKQPTVIFGTGGGVALLVLVNVVIFTLTDYIVGSIDRENQLYAAKTLVKEQETQYTLITEKNELVMKLRHDYRNALIGMLYDIKSGNIESVEHQITDQLGVLEQSREKDISGNSVLDAVLRYKTETAGKYGVTIRSSYRNVHEIPIPNVDFSILLGNALDNAIEAAANNEESDKYVDLFVCVREKQLIMQIKNPVKKDMDVSNLKTSKDGYHGYGIISMKMIAEKHHGSVNLSCENGVFTNSIII